MKIQFKTGGMLVEHLPEGTPGDEIELDVPVGSTPLSVMQRLGFDPALNDATRTLAHEIIRRSAP